MSPPLRIATLCKKFAIAERNLNEVGGEDESATEAYFQAMKRVEETPARTPAEMLAKWRVAYEIDPEGDELSPEIRRGVLASIGRDIERSAKEWAFWRRLGAS